MKSKSLKILIISCFSVFMLLQFGVTKAEASWGASKIIEANYPNYEVPHYPTPDTDNQSIADLIKSLRNSTYSSSPDNNDPANNMPEQNQPEPQEPEQKNNQDNQDISINQDAFQLFEWVNNERTSRGLNPLVLDEDLIDFAQKRSKYISEDPFERMNHSGMAAGGENLCYTSTITKAHNFLMACNDHRKNILNSRYKRIGIGVSYDRNGYVIVVETFQI